jgi:signal peptidase I
VSEALGVTPPASDRSVAPTPGSAERDAARRPRRRRRLNPRVRNILEWVVVIGGAVIVTILLRTFAFQTFYIPSGSMLPTLQIGDRIIVNKLANDHSVGDIVVFTRPDTWRDAEHDVLIKRIIAVGDQTFEIRDGNVYLDGQELREPYLAEGTSMRDFGPITLESDEVFMLGDNRNFSLDSIENGPVPTDNIVGRAALRIWPFSAFGGV